MTYDERLDMFNSNQALALSIVGKHWYNAPMTHDDLVQEALIALWSATETYDPSIAAFSTYATNYIYHSLTNYAYTAKYGKVGAKSNFRDAMAIVKQAKKQERCLDDVLKETNASPAIVTYARLIYYGDESFVSLYTPLYADNEGSELTIGDVIPSEEKLEEDVCRNLYDKQIIELFDKKFVPYCLQTKAVDTERRIKLLKYYKENIFGTKIQQIDIAKRLGMSKNSVSLQFKRWDKRFRKLLRQEAEALRY